MPLDWPGVSSRINEFLKIGDAQDVARVAQSLGIRPDELDETIRGGSKLSTLKATAAIVRVYGIDPSWLLTGAYDAATHKIALRKNQVDIDRVIRRLVTERDRESSSRDRTVRG